MHRVDSPGSVDGQFQDGNPATGQQATQMLAKWFNATQEEIATVVEQAGIILDDADNGQLYQAIVQLVAGVVGDGSGAVPTVRQVLGGGLVTGGGDLAADRTLSVIAATIAEVSAQVRNDVAVTPAGMAGLIDVRISGGSLVIQFASAKIMVFTGTVTGNGTTVLSLPEAFTTTNFGAFANGGISDAGAQDNGPFVSGKGLTTVSVHNGLSNTLSTQIVAFGV